MSVERMIGMKWKLFPGASVEHLKGQVWILTVKREHIERSFRVQNGLGEPIPPDVNQLSVEELEAILKAKKSGFESYEKEA